MSFIKLSNESQLLLMMSRYLRCSTVNPLWPMDSAMPTMAFIGVLISCDILERNSDWPATPQARLPAPPSARARSA